MEHGLGGQGSVLLSIYYYYYLVTNVTAILEVITNDNITLSLTMSQQWPRMVLRTQKGLFLEVWNYEYKNVRIAFMGNGGTNTSGTFCKGTAL